MPAVSYLHLHCAHADATFSYHGTVLSANSCCVVVTFKIPFRCCFDVVSMDSFANDILTAVGGMAEQA